MTLAKVDAIQNFYGRAIWDNKGDPENMAKSIKAILKHYSDKNDDSECPKGELSWCSYQRDVATGLKTYKPTKNPFTDAMIKVMSPLFTRLSDKGFLENCKKCHTQNANESFNNVLWGISPKNQFVSPVETSLAVKFISLFL